MHIIYLDEFTFFNFIYMFFKICIKKNIYKREKSKERII